MRDAHSRGGSSDSIEACTIYAKEAPGAEAGRILGGTAVKVGPNFARCGEVYCWTEGEGGGLVADYVAAMEEVAHLVAGLYMMRRGEPECARLSRSVQVTQVRVPEKERKALFLRAFVQHVHAQSRSVTVLAEVCDPAYTMRDEWVSPQPIMRCVADVHVLPPGADMESVKTATGAIASKAEKKERKKKPTLKKRV